MIGLDKNLLFSIAAAISFLGVSLISFLAGSLVNEKSQQLFQYLYSFSTGIIFGISLSFGLHPYIVSEDENYQIVHLITSMSFTIMLGIKFYYTTSSYDYNHVLSNHSLERDIELIENKMEYNEIEMRRKHSLYQGSENETEVSNQDNIKSDTNKLIALKISLVLLIISSSITDLLLGLILIFIPDSSHKLFSMLFIEKSLLAVSLGTLLESSSVPSSLFLSSMFTCSFSSPIGLVLGLLLIYNDISLSQTNALSTIKFIYSISHSFSCGIYLYIAMMHMIPSGIYHLQEKQQYQNVYVLNNNNNLNTSTQQSHQRQQDRDCCTLVQLKENSFQNHKIILFITFVFGYLCIIVPNIISSI